MNFQEEVIEASKDLPVVVDFWAPWCGPCKVLGPIIEGLAEEQKEKWKLVKVNSDENPEISAEYKIKGIPAVKMFVGGEVSAEFTGSLPKGQIESWLEEHLPDERKIRLAELKEQLEKGTLALKELQDFVEENPDLDEAKMLLAKATIFEQPDKAKEQYTSLIQPFKFTTEIEDLKSLGDFMNCELGDSSLADKLINARQSVLNSDFDIALELLIEVVMVDKNFCDEMPRRATIALFHWLGDQHELTKKHRRRFDLALY